MNIKEGIEILLVIIGIATSLYYVPYLIRRGWGTAANKTNKDYEKRR